MKKAYGTLLFMLVCCYMAYSQPISDTDKHPFCCQREYNTLFNEQDTVYDLSGSGCVSVILVFTKTDSSKAQSLYEISHKGKLLYTVLSNGQVTGRNYLPNTQKDTSSRPAFDSNSPVILSGIYKIAAKAKDSVHVKLLHIGADSSKSGSEHVIESLIYNAKVSKVARMSAETYLALKYGVSLEGVDYLSPQGGVIWSHDSNGAYSHSIAGIGLDTTYHLYNKEGVSPMDTFLRISLSDSCFLLQPETYMLWGHNGGGLTRSARMVLPEKQIPSSGDTLVLLNRRWMMQYTDFGNPLTKVRIQKDALEQDTVYLLIGNEGGFDDSVYCYKSTCADSEYWIFPEVDWKAAGSGRKAFAVGYKYQERIHKNTAFMAASTDEEWSEDENGAVEIKIYPVPSVDYLHVYTGMSGEKTVSIYDMTGKEVISRQSVQADAFVVDVSFLSAGIYLLKLIGDAEVHSKIFVKTN